MNTQKLNEAFVLEAMENLSKEQAIEFIATVITHRNQKIKELDNSVWTK